MTRALSCWGNAGSQHRTHILELLHKKNQIAGLFIQLLHPVIVWGLFRGWGDAFILALPASFIGQSRLQWPKKFLNQRNPRADSCKTLSWHRVSKEIKPVDPKRNQPWSLIGRTDVEAQAPILWPPDAKSQLFGKDPDDGKDWGQEEKGATEDEMFGWHH